MATIFLDIAGAFDNDSYMDSYILLEDLREIGIPALSRKFVENLISVRHLNFVIDGELHRPYDAYKDTFQRSTLVHFYLTFTKDFERHLHQDTRFLQYADDVILFSTYREINKAISSI